MAHGFPYGMVDSLYRIIQKPHKDVLKPPRRFHIGILRTFLLMIVPLRVLKDGFVKNLSLIFFLC